MYAFGRIASCVYVLIYVYMVWNPDLCWSTLLLERNGAACSHQRTSSRCVRTERGGRGKGLLVRTPEKCSLVRTSGRCSLVRTPKINERNTTK